MQQSTIRVATILLCILLNFGCGDPESMAALSTGQDGMEETVTVPATMGMSPDQPFSLEEFRANFGRQGRDTDECFQLRRGGKGNRCEPQSLPFARCRSGIISCRSGHENGPLTWFTCEKWRGNTSLIPRPGSILILAANTRRKMPTGHVAYVEDVVAQSDTVYRLTFTHTNYDRKCSLESNITATYDSAARTLDIHDGAWGAWGKGLPVAGFILE